MPAIHNNLKNPVILFLFKSGLVFALWETLNWLGMHTGFHQIWDYLHVIVRVNIVDTTFILLKCLGYCTIKSGIIVRICESPGVAVGPACVGFGILFAFAGLIISYHGPFRKKIWFIPLGLIGIHLINIIRTTVLAIISLYNNDIVEFNHKYVTSLVMYIFIFIMFIRWVKIADGDDVSKKPIINP